MKLRTILKLPSSLTSLFLAGFFATSAVAQEEPEELVFLDEVLDTLNEIKKEDPEASGYVLVPEKPSSLETAYELVVTVTYFYYKLILTNTIYFVDLISMNFYKDQQSIDEVNFLEDISPFIKNVSDDVSNNNTYINTLKRERLAS